MEIVGTVSVAVLLVLLTAALLYVLGRLGAVKEKVVLLCGISGSGKTAMFLRLATGAFVPTFVSSIPNEVDLQFDNGVLHVVDMPGSEELRSLVVDRLKVPICAIIFVVDSCTFPKESKEVSEFLYEIFAALRRTKSKCDKMLIACTKQDLIDAKSCNSIKLVLQREINLLSKTMACALDSTKVTGFAVNASAANAMADGQLELSFDRLTEKVDFCDCSSKFSNESDEKSTLRPVRDWLRVL